MNAIKPIVRILLICNSNFGRRVHPEMLSLHRFNSSFAIISFVVDMYLIWFDHPRCAYDSQLRYTINTTDESFEWMDFHFRNRNALHSCSSIFPIRSECNASENVDEYWIGNIASKVYGLQNHHQHCSWHSVSVAIVIEYTLHIHLKPKSTFRSGSSRWSNIFLPLFLCGNSSFVP